MNTKKEQIDILQKHLSSIRKIAGWTLEELGEKIGVTKQTISNLENDKTKMTLTQYLAIMTILDYEIKDNKDNIVLSHVVEILLNRNEEFSDEEFKEISKNVETIAATASGGIKGDTLISLAENLLAGPIVGPFAGNLAKKWLSKMIKDKKNKKDEK
jgi:transcriptional regulator with XRE-family HTH domain